MTLLALETATDVCSVALWQDGHPTSELTLRRPRAHAEQLIPMIEAALEQSQVARQDLGGVAVSMGPGSYTGLRIGASTAKGLAAALDVPLVGVPSLEAQAAQALPWAAPGDRIAAAFNARRNEVYAALYLVEEQAGLEEIAPTSVLRSEEIGAWAGEAGGGRCWVVGEGGADVAAVMERGGTDVRRLPSEVVAPSAAWVARRAWGRIERGETSDVAAFEPFYLKAFVARKAQRTALEKLSF